jgi:hypothetical protein
MEQPDDSYLLDAATAAKEVATLTALCLMQTGGDPNAAITMLDSLAPHAPPLQAIELDAARIGEQAIREAIALRDGLAAA